MRRALSLNTELPRSLPIPCSCPRPQHSSLGGEAEGKAKTSLRPRPPSSTTVLLPLALISLSHWSMIHVREGPGLLALCTAAYCHHCACFSSPSPVYNDWTHSGSASDVWRGWFFFLSIFSFLQNHERVRDGLGETDGQTGMVVMRQEHAERTLLTQMAARCVPECFWVTVCFTCPREGEGKLKFISNVVSTKSELFLQKSK